MRPIDADTLFNQSNRKLSEAIKYGNGNPEQQHWSYSTMMMYEIDDEIDDAPTLDVSPTIHGQRERTINAYGDPEGFICQCRHQGQNASNYCPNCGAVMDGKG